MFTTLIFMVGSYYSKQQVLIEGSKNEKGGVKRDTRQETAYLSKLKN